MFHIVEEVREDGRHKQVTEAKAHRCGQDEPVAAGEIDVRKNTDARYRDGGEEESGHASEDRIGNYDPVETRLDGSQVVIQDEYVLARKTPEILPRTPNRMRNIQQKRPAVRLAQRVMAMTPLFCRQSDYEWVV